MDQQGRDSQNIGTLTLVLRLDSEITLEEFQAAKKEFEDMVKSIHTKWLEATPEQRADLLKLSNLPNDFHTHSE